MSVAAVESGRKFAILHAESFINAAELRLAIEEVRHWIASYIKSFRPEDLYVAKDAHAALCKRYHASPYLNNSAINDELMHLTHKFVKSLEASPVSATTRYEIYWTFKYVSEARCLYDTEMDIVLRMRKLGVTILPGDLDLYTWTAFVLNGYIYCIKSLSDLRVEADIKKLLPMEHPDIPLPVYERLAEIHSLMVDGYKESLVVKKELLPCD